MKQNFDQVINRYNTNSVKYDFAMENGKPEDILPLWVADMDFPAPEAVVQKLQEVSRFGIFGYSEGKESYYAAIQNWYQKRFNWAIEDDWILKTPGVVFAVSMAVRALTEPGDGVMIQQPVYYPFRNVIRDNNRKVVNNPLVLCDGHYEMDLVDFEKKLKTENVKLLILCSPHNPVGRVWTDKELKAVGKLCLKYNVKVISDEIHADFVYEGYKHSVFANLDERFRDICVTCTAPSKTFNLAGLQVSNIIIPNYEMRKKVYREIRSTGYGGLSIMGIAACQTAYEFGEEWLEELKKYLSGNLDYVRTFIREKLPGVKLVEPEGTYLIWLDLRELGLSAEEQESLIVNKAGLWLDSGSMFGDEGVGFERINIACPRATLERAMMQLEKAL